MTGYEVIEAFLARRGVRFGPGSTLRPGDADSWHGTGQARDFGLANSDADLISRIFAPIAQAHGDLVVELFGSDGTGFDAGLPYQAPGHTGDHTHVAVAPGTTLEQLEAAAAGVGVPMATSTTTPPSTAAPDPEKASAWLGNPRGIWRIIEGIIGAGAILAGLIMLSKTLRTLVTKGGMAVATKGASLAS